MAIAGFAPSAPLEISCPHPDSSQRRVIDLSPTRSCVVWGAPGSGKTAVAIELVAARVEREGWSPDDIIVLTPQRLAANRLRDALAARLAGDSSGALAMSGPRARTPMSLAFSLAVQQSASLGTEPVRLLTGSEQDAMFNDILRGEIADDSHAWPDELHADIRLRRVFRTELRELLSRAQEHGLTDEGLAQLGRQLGIPAWESAASFWKRYRQIVALARPDHFDSSEILSMASHALTSPSVMPNVKLVILDDAQEATAGVISLLKGFAQRGVPVVALGDPDTSTTTFRGAIPEFLGRMATDLSLPVDAVDKVVLTHVYRHGSALREFVRDTTASLGSALAGEQRAATAYDSTNASDAAIDTPPFAPIVSVERTSRASEVAAIARALREIVLSEAVDWSDMVVLVRNGTLVSSYARALAAAGIPTRTLLSETSLQKHVVARNMITILKMALGRESLTRENVAEILVTPFGGLSALELRRLRLAFRHDMLADGQLVPGGDMIPHALMNPGLFLAFDFSPARRAHRFAETLSLVREQSHTGASVEELLWTIWDRSGLAKTWREQALSSGIIADEANRNLDAVLGLFTAARRFVERSPLAPSDQFITEFERSDVPEDSLSLQAEMNSVLVATPSAVIGGQWDTVVVAGLQENVWPNLRPRGTLLHAQRLVRHLRGQDVQTIDTRREVSDDERRMFVMAVSRARARVLVTAHAGDDDLPSSLFLRSAARATPMPAQDGGVDWSPTLRGLTGYLRRVVVTGGSRAEDATKALARLAEEGVPGAHPDQWLGTKSWSTDLPLIDMTSTDIENERVFLSPSKLDSWETNQLVWFIDSIVASETSPASGLGTLLHSAMEKIAPAGVSTGEVSATEIVEQLEVRWSELETTFEAPWQSDVERRRARALSEALAQYLSDFDRLGGRLLSGEGAFVLILDDENSPEPVRVTVRGKIDRVEQRHDGAVVIADLKTGKSKVAVKDLPQNGQLTCYQLAVDVGALPDVPAEATSGGAKLIFIAESTARKLYTERPQNPGNSEFFETARERIRSAARGMSGKSFIGRLFESEERGEFASRYEYRIHLVPAVTR